VRDYAVDVLRYDNGRSAELQCGITLTSNVQMSGAKVGLKIAEKIESKEMRQRPLQSSMLGLVS